MRGRGSGPSKYSGGVNHSDVAPIEGSCSAIGLHLLIEPVTRPLASWNVVTPLLSVRAVPVTRRRTNWSIASHEDQGGERARRGGKSCDHVRGRHFLVLWLPRANCGVSLHHQPVRCAGLNLQCPQATCQLNHSFSASSGCLRS